MALSDINTAIAGLEAALAADAANPQPTVTIDGKTVSREEWREGLIKALEGLKRQANAYAPYLIRTAQRL